MGHHLNDESMPGRASILCYNKGIAEKLVDNLRLTRLSGKRMWIQFMRDPTDSTRNEHLEGQTTSVMIHNLHYTVQQQQSLSMVSGFGRVVECRVLAQNGYPKGI